MTRDLDLVLLGATGFAGRHVARELSGRAPEGFRWALAARSADRLAEVARETGAPEAVTVDVHDAPALRALVARARVVLNTVGPFTRYGDPVVEACAEHGTHYADLTGEVPWMRRVAGRFHAGAKRAGTVFVPASGFDSVPADLALLELARAAAADGDRLDGVEVFYHLSGGLNGGTLASALEIAKSGDGRLLGGPWALVPDVHVPPDERERHADPERPAWDPVGHRWGAPFFMHPINSRVVRRSIVLGTERGFPGAPDVELDPVRLGYAEYQTLSRHGGRVRTEVASRVQRFGERALRHRAGRWVARRLGPAPGEGPSDSALAGGRTALTARGVAASGAEWIHTQRAEGDPGNRVTARCLVQCGLSLAEDGERLGFGPGRGGVLTPASAFGTRLVERLAATGEHTFETVRRDARSSVSAP